MLSAFVFGKSNPSYSPSNYAQKAVRNIDTKRDTMVEIYIREPSAHVVFKLWDSNTEEEPRLKVHGG